MALPRMEDRLFADHAIAFNQIEHPARIGDPPVPGQQLHRLRRIVLNPDMIEPKPLACLDLRLIGQEIDRDPHGDAFSDRGVLEQLFHSPPDSDWPGRSQWPVYAIALRLKQRPWIWSVAGQ